MKFSIQQQQFNKAINQAIKAISTKTTMDILKSFLIESTKEGRLKIIGNDLNTGIEATVDASIETAGRCVVDGRLLSEIIKKLPDETIECYNDEQGNFNIKCLNSSFVLASGNPDEFVDLPTVANQEAVKIDKYVLSDMIKQTIFATSTDESRPILTGSLFKIESAKMTMVSIDLYRVAIRSIHIQSDTAHSVVIPAKALAELLKIINTESQSETISVYFTDKYIKFALDDIVVITRLLEGEFINYEQIMPTSYKTLLTCSREKLFRAIDRAALLATKGNNVSVIFNIDNDQIEISTNVEIGSVSEKVAVQIEGPALKIGFNPRYWLDVLRVIDSDEITVELTTNNQPCIVKPKDNQAYTYLLLPVRILS